MVLKMVVQWWGSMAQPGSNSLGRTEWVEQRDGSVFQWLTETVALLDLEVEDASEGLQWSGVLGLL